jgi:RHS repeat-associated protein
VLAEHNGSTGAVLTDYIFAGSRMIAKFGSTSSYFLSDRLSVRLSINTTTGSVVGRQAHLPFGEPFGESGTQDKKHLTSYERDVETGTDYAVNRQYAHIVGRFMRVDPLAGSIGDPQSLNRYAYVRSDPINRTDPLGLMEPRQIAALEDILSRTRTVAGNVWLTTHSRSYQVAGP